MMIDGIVGHEKSRGASGTRWWQRWSLRRKIIVGATILVIVVVLAVGLGVGLGRGKGSDDDEEKPPVPPNGTIPTEIWKPEAGTSWNYKLLGPVDTDSLSGEAEVWDIDLFDNDETVIESLHSKGKKVICYFSAGSFEDWRPDKDEFQDADLGNELDGWPGERWLNTKSENVRKIMRERLDLAVRKGCDGVDPDNIDAYDNENGLNLQEPDAVDYVNFLADEAHSRNLSVSLKNAGSIVPTVLDKMDYSVQEQCLQFDNCNQFQPFIEANKPVFHVEYPKGDDTNNNNLVATDTKDSLCDNPAAAGFSTIIKNMDLDDFIQPCPTNSTRSG